MGHEAHGSPKVGMPVPLRWYWDSSRAQQLKRPGTVSDFHLSRYCLERSVPSSASCFWLVCPVQILTGYVCCTLEKTASMPLKQAPDTGATMRSPQ